MPISQGLPLIVGLEAKLLGAQTRRHTEKVLQDNLDQRQVLAKTFWKKK